MRSLWWRQRSVVVCLLGVGSLAACGLGEGGSGPGPGPGGSGTGGAVPVGGLGAGVGGADSASGGSGSANGGSAAGGASAGGLGGDPGSAMGGGAGGQLPEGCPPLPAECEPLSDGCSPRGEKYHCSACGQMELGGESCARLLVSDKEAGLTCVVRGETTLACAGGATEWSENLKFPVELEEFPTVLALSDDSGATSNELLQYCWINEQGEIGCTPGYQPLGGESCTGVAISDGRICSICSGVLDCDDGEASATSALEVVMSDSFAAWLSSEGQVFQRGNPAEGTFLPGAYKDIFSDSSSIPCGISQEGALVCGRGFEVPGLLLEGEFVMGEGFHERICLLEQSGAVRCVTHNEDEYSPLPAPEGTSFTTITTTTNYSCALTKTGDVVCWDNNGPREDLSEKLN